MTNPGRRNLSRLRLGFGIGVFLFIHASDKQTPAVTTDSYGGS